MNCRDAQEQFFDARDGALDPNQQAMLETHVAQCSSCQRIRDDLDAGLAAWRADSAAITVPDAGREWQDVRRRIRGGTTAGTNRDVGRLRRNIFSWLVIPLGLAAAVAVTLYFSPGASLTTAAGTTVAEVARADFVEAPGNNASTMVFVDDKSGWLIVWATDATAPGAQQI